MKILCFGDSNTFGHVPGGNRYKKRVRWPGRLQKLLGEAHQVIEEGVCGRTNAFEDKFLPGRCGLYDIGTDMELYAPVDLLIVMLGTNDCKTQFHASPAEIADGLENVLKKAGTSAENPFRTLIIAPAALKELVSEGDFGAEFDSASVETSKALAGEFKKLSQKYDAFFLDASEVTEVSDVDGVHLDEEGHRALAEAVYDLIREMPGANEEPS